ncbi:putative NagC family transcriptional regulator [Kineosphaera limosa NBRC 100340]|uniref:Putative NagC family transcriptional regulator n=1 Tax=Kineosphaera limosa NBRC 100340 TaxID=1184609 RepID=K6VJM6_9MICO|nr:ROK family transcriptional regulator [Kineosphaera limosa]GAB96418.1 putative NagC family transcriptional regulator [Kineosphaera limosa NBRC 100340]
MLRLAHISPGITRTQACRQLGISSGTATELIDRLRTTRLLAEVPAPAQGRGRPTTVLAAHPQGPLAIAVELGSVRWRVHLADLAGAITQEGEGAVGDAAPGEVLARIAECVAAVERRHAGRVRAVTVVAAGLVSGTRLVQFTIRGWRDVELQPIVGLLPADSGVALLVGNDATLGGVAEARTGAARAARVILYLLVDVGLGGALLADGVPMTGAQGAGGEFGHVPYGDRSLPCPCGAFGCWDLMIDGRALARHLGDAAPADSIAYARELLAAPLDPRRQEAVRRVVRDLAAGVAGLVNANDPDVVTLAGLGPALRAAAPEAFNDAYSRGLMAFHRAEPPPVVDSAYRDDGPLRGAVAMAVDAITSPAELETWAARA